MNPTTQENCTLTRAPSRDYAADLMNQVSALRACLDRQGDYRIPCIDTLRSQLSAHLMATAMTMQGLGADALWRRDLWMAFDRMTVNATAALSDESLDQVEILGAVDSLAINALYVQSLIDEFASLAHAFASSVTAHETMAEHAA